VRSDARPLRVVHVCWRLSRTGGIPIVIRSLVGCADPSAVEHHVVTVRPDLPEDQLASIPCAVHPLGLSGPSTLRLWARAAPRAARIARRLRPDIVHAHSGTALLSALSAVTARPRLRILDVHDAPGNGRHGALTEQLEGVLCRSFRYQPVVHSSSVAEECQRFWRLRRPPVIVPLGIPTDHFDAGDREARSPGGDPPTVLYVARLVPSKDVSLLIRVAGLVSAVPEHANTRFVVVADGPERSRLEAEVDAAGLAGVVRLDASRTGDALVAAYRDADVFLSTSAYEGFGLAVVEAMAAGLPVVATSVGGVTDLVVDGETGLLAPAGEAEPLADHVMALLADAERARRYGSAGRDRARRRFDVASMAAAYGEVYQAAARVRLAVLKSPQFGSSDDSHLPYRIDHMRSAGVELRWTDRHLRSPFTSAPLSTPLAAIERRAVPFVQTCLLLGEIIRSDATLAFFESEANALATMRRIVPTLRRRPLVVITCWLADVILQDPRRGNRYRSPYQHVNRLIVLSSNQRSILIDHLGLEPARLHFVPFGVDHDFFRPLGGTDEDYVACVGRDKGRDWPTFMAAAKRTGLPVKVACRPSDLRDVDVPDNVEVLGYLDTDAYRSLVGKARVSVVPTVERAYASGQTVALESMAMRRATVITSTPAMADYLRPGVTGVGVPVGDAAALAEAIESTYFDGDLRQRLGENGRAAVEARFNARAMWTDIAAIVADAIAERRGPSR